MTTSRITQADLARRHSVGSVGRVVARASLLLCAVSTVAWACSKDSFTAFAGRKTAFMLARAGTDTVRTGPGSVQLRVALGHAGPAVSREIFGLAMDVERIAGPARREMPAGTTRVIIVPWDYGADCTPTPWSRSVRWVMAGSRGMYTAVLRPRTQWVGGVPTLDSHSPMTEPYVPAAVARRDATAESPDSTLGLDEMMDVSDLLPMVSDISRDPTAAIRPVYDWVRANPARARHAPVPAIVAALRMSELSAALRTVRHPAVGTYRLTLEADSLPSATLFARMVATPTTGSYRRRAGLRVDPIDLPPYDTYSYLVYVSTSADSLPATCTHAAFASQGGYFTLLPDPLADTMLDRRYPMEVELNVFSHAFPNDVDLRALVQQSFEASFARFKRNEPASIRGEVLIGSDGTTRLSQVETLPDGRRVKVRGQRVSTAVVRCGF